MDNARWTQAATVWAYLAFLMSTMCYILLMGAGPSGAFHHGGDSLGGNVGRAVASRHQLITEITADPSVNYLIPATPEP